MCCMQIVVYEYSQSSISSWPSSKYKDRPARIRELEGRIYSVKPVINIPSLSPYTTTPDKMKGDLIAVSQTDTY